MSYTPAPQTPSDGKTQEIDDAGQTARMPSPGLELDPPGDPADEPTNLVPHVPHVAQGTRPPPLAIGSKPGFARAKTPRPTPNTIARGSSEELAKTRPRGWPIQAEHVLGGYRITGTLASGQMGVVYRGEHATERRAPVAIKSVHAQQQQNPAVVARFFAESVALARVVHPNIVRFHDFGYDASGSAFLVMELLEGETLAKRLARERRLDIGTAVDIATQLAQALVAAHALGVIHRDVKPENVFVCSDGTVKLLDFGIAKIEGQGPMQTMQGDLLGTAAYMAPEQGRSASDSDGRSDLYSLGCVVFEMLCGVVPFPGTLVETLLAHQTAQRPPARALNPDVPQELDELTDQLLARDPAKRPQSAADVVRALAQLARPRLPRSGTELVREDSARVRITPTTSAAFALGILATLIVLLLAYFAVR